MMNTYELTNAGWVRFAPEEIQAINHYYQEGIRVTLKNGRIYVVAMRHKEELERIMGKKL